MRLLGIDRNAISLMLIYSFLSDYILILVELFISISAFFLGSKNRASSHFYKVKEEYCEQILNLVVSRSGSQNDI